MAVDLVNNEVDQFFWHTLVRELSILVQFYGHSVIRSYRRHSADAPVLFSVGNKSAYAVSKIGIRFGRSQINQDSEK